MDHQCFDTQQLIVYPPLGSFACRSAQWKPFAEVDEFRVTVIKVRQMDEMDIEVELCEGADTDVVHEIAIKLDSFLVFRPRVYHVAHYVLPRFEKRFIRLPCGSRQPDIG